MFDIVLIAYYQGLRHPGHRTEIQTNNRCDLRKFNDGNRSNLAWSQGQAENDLAVAAINKSSSKRLLPSLLSLLVVVNMFLCCNAMRNQSLEGNVGIDELIQQFKNVDLSVEMDLEIKRIHPPAVQEKIKQELLDDMNFCIDADYFLEIPFFTDKIVLCPTLVVSAHGTKIYSWERLSNNYKNSIKVQEFENGSNINMIARLGFCSIASGLDDGSINVIRLHDDTDICQTLAGHTAAVQSITNIDYASFASGSDDGSIIIWEWRADRSCSYECKQVLQTHSGSVSALIAHENLLISGSSDKMIRIWRKIDGIYKYERMLLGHYDEIAGFIKFSNGLIASVTLGRIEEQTNRLWYFYEHESPRQVALIRALQKAQASGQEVVLHDDWKQITIPEVLQGLLNKA